MKFFSLPVLLLVAIPVSLSFLPNNIGREISAAPGMRVNRVMLFRAYPYEVRPGGSVTLEGSGFSRSLNKVYFDGSNPITATSTNGTTMAVVVPNSLPEGQYQLTVSNTLGSSENPDIKIPIKVTSAPQPGPTIKNASLSGETVTLLGEGFTVQNTVMTTLGNSPATLYSDGTTLSFRLSELSQYDQVKKQLQGNQYLFTLWIFVQNEHGTNKNPYKLDIVL